MDGGLEEARRRIRYLMEFGDDRLDLSGLGLAEVPREVWSLTGLVELDLSRNELTVVPPEIGSLAALRLFQIYGNRLTVLPPEIGLLAELTWLNASGNELAVLPSEIGSLANLTRLWLVDNKLTSLPLEIAELPLYTELDVRGNPLTIPPPEVVASGTQSVMSCFRALRREGEIQWTSKMLVVGQGTVGKTSVYKALCDQPYDPQESRTHGVHVDMLHVPHPTKPSVTMDLGVWDFGGQLEYRATQRFYMTDGSLIMLVYNARAGWGPAGGQIEAWLDAISSAAPRSPIMIVATHSGDSVTDLDVQALRREYPNIQGLYQVECEPDEHGVRMGIEDLRRQIAHNAAYLDGMGTPWPRSWADATRRLAEEPGPFISRGKAVKLLLECGLDGEESAAILLSLLHHRGQILHFAHDPELQDMVVVKPSWIDGMITRVLDSRVVQQRGGMLSRTHRAELWHDLDAIGLDDKLTAMMDRFDLAYRIDGAGHDDVALVVERLPQGEPAVLPGEWDAALAEPGAAELRITFKLESRQAGIPSWFIAREHRHSTGVAWARGVLLRHHGAATDAWALLVDDGKAEPTLRLTVRGTAPRVFYSILVEAFTEIVTERYRGLTVAMLVPCPCADEVEPPCRHEFAYQTAMKAVDAGIDLQCHESLRMIDPRMLLIGLKTPQTEKMLTQLQRSVDEVAVGTARIQDSVLRTLDTVRDLLGHRAAQGVYSPGIFTLTKTGWRRYRLRLFCEQPDAPHPLPDGAGVYELKKIPDWLRDYAPYLKLLVAGLKLGLPLIGPAISSIFGDVLTEQAKAELELSSKLLEDLRLPAGAHPNFDQLSKALVELDPGLGGLRLRELPENRRVVYLCQHHADALHFPAQIPWG